MYWTVRFSEFFVQVGGNWRREMNSWVRRPIDDTNGSSHTTFICTTLLIVRIQSIGDETTCVGGVTSPCWEYSENWQIYWYSTKLPSIWQNFVNFFQLFKWKKGFFSYEFVYNFWFGKILCSDIVVKFFYFTSPHHRTKSASFVTASHVSII